MTDRDQWQNRGGGAGSGSLGGQGFEVDENDEERDEAGLGDARPGAGPNWTPGTSASGTGIGGQDTETRPGSWGNRSGSGSGGEGERELDQDQAAGNGGVTDDITGSTGTNG